MFHARVVNGFDAAINQATADLAARWRGHPAHTPLALDREMSRLTFRIVGETLFAVVARRSYTLDVGDMLVGVRNDGLVADRGLEIARVGDEFALLCVRLQTQSSMRALRYDVSSMRTL